MKYAIIAAIHANLEALQAVLTDMKEQSCTRARKLRPGGTPESSPGREPWGAPEGLSPLRGFNFFERQTQDWRPGLLSGAPPGLGE